MSDATFYNLLSQVDKWAYKEAQRWGVDNFDTPESAQAAITSQVYEAVLQMVVLRYAENFITTEDFVRLCRADRQYGGATALRAIVTCNIGLAHHSNRCKEDTSDG
ncbi:MAG: hypothetical protein ACO23F_05745 [Candidatus Limnocylindrus sp.]